MDIGVRTQAANGLLELPQAADLVATAGLVPGDSGVHQSLEEVPLCRRRGPPGLFESLVGLEVRALLDALESLSVLLLDRVQRVRRAAHWPFSGGEEGGMFMPVATILVAGIDLFFRGKLDAVLGGTHKLVTTESVDPPDLVIVDIARVDPDEVADAYPDTPILGFTNHTDTEGLRRAKAAGFDRVVARSALAERAGELVDELVL